MFSVILASLVGLVYSSISYAEFCNLPLSPGIQVLALYFHFIYLLIFNLRESMHEQGRDGGGGVGREGES